MLTGSKAGVTCGDKKAKKTSLQTTVPENLDNKEDPKRDIHGSNLLGK